MSESVMMNGMQDAVGEPTTVDVPICRWGKADPIVRQHDRACNLHIIAKGAAGCGAVVCLGVGASSGGIAFTILAIAAVFLLGLSGAFQQLPKVEVDSYEEALKEDPDDELAEIVAITIYQDGIVTGTDRGLMSVVDNAILFIGKRSEFVVGRQHLQEGPTAFRPEYPARSADSAMIHLRHPEREIWVRVRVLSASQDHEPSDAKLLRYLPKFLRYHKKPTLEQAMYPPLALDPSIPTKKPSALSLYVTVAFCCALVILSNSFNSLFLSISVALIGLAPLIIQTLDRKKPNRRAILFSALTTHPESTLALQTGDDSPWTENDFLRSQTR